MLKFNNVRIPGNILAGLLVILIAVSGCVSKPQQETARSNMAFLYNPSSSPLHPEFIVFHEAQTQSRVYIKVYPVELLFNQDNTEGTYQARLEINYVLTEIIEGKESELVADSNTVEFTLNMDEVKNIFVANLPIRTMEGMKYMLKVTTTDLLRRKGTSNYIHVDRSTVNTGQNYMVTGSNGFPSFDRVFHSDEYFHIKYNRRGVDTVYVKYYQNITPLPRPPVTNLSSTRPDFIADSIFAYPLQRYHEGPSA